MNHYSQQNNHVVVDNKVQSFYIRTLCSYEPSLDKGLPGKGLKFKPGDLLLVINANDNQWWQAMHIRRNLFLSSNNMNNSTILSKERGLIPSLERVRNKSRFQKRHVEFDSRAVVIGPTGKLVSEMINSPGCSSFDLKRLRKFNNNRKPLDKSICGTDLENNFTNPYEIIEQAIIKTPRPIVVIGPGKDQLYEYLLVEFPDIYNTPIPHTTRQPRPGERDGIDYHFVINKEELENETNASKYIDVGKFKGNFYANSIESVRQALEKSKYPLLDISHNGIEKLRSASIYPICILISTSSLSQAKTLQGDGRQLNLDIQSTRDYTIKLEKEFSVLFDVIISPSTPSEMKEQVVQLVHAYQRSPTWMAAEDQSLLNIRIDKMES